MAYVAVPAARRERRNFGVVALIVLGLISVVSGVRNPEAVPAESQTTAIALVSR